MVDSGIEIMAVPPGKKITSINTLSGGEKAMAEYETVNQRFEFLSTQSTDLENAIESLTRVIEELDEIIKKHPSQSFSGLIQQFVKKIVESYIGGSRLQITVDFNQPNQNRGFSILAYAACNMRFCA